MRHRVGLSEILGLRPLGPALKQCWLALAGNRYMPPSRFGPSSLRILKPRLSLPLWAGRMRADRRVVIFNLYNRRPIDRHAGYSVRVTDCEDFRGGRLTYDGHVGTDFPVPPGTEVVAPAPGIVRQVRTDMQRGGLKVIIDHGRGVVTASCHLSRVLVEPGRRLARGEPFGLSGMSGIDGVLCSPWLAPHVHFTVTLNGETADPFAAAGEVSLWHGGNYPVPHDPAVVRLEDRDFEPTRWDQEAVEASIAGCRDPDVRAGLLALRDPDDRAVATVADRFLKIQLFEDYPPLVRRPCPRRALLTLPFLSEDVSGIVFPDDVPVPQAGSTMNER